MRARLERVVFIAALSCLAAGCGRRSHVVEDQLLTEAQLPAGGTVHLRNTVGQIAVTRAPGSDVRVFGAKRWHYGSEDDVHFLWTRSGDALYACAVWGTHGQCDAGGYRSSRPSASILRIFSLFHRHRSDMRADLTVMLPAGLALDASTTSGSLRVSGATGGVLARNVNGSITLDRVAGPVDARTVNGSIAVTLDSLVADAPLRLESVNGSVSAGAPEGLQGQVRLSTVNGSVTSTFPVVSSGSISRHRIEGRIGDSPREISLKSVNGSVRLLRTSRTAAAVETTRAVPNAPVSAHPGT